MSFPSTFCDLHLCEYGFKAGVLRTACINTKADCATAIVHVANAHLLERYTINGTLQAEVVSATAKAVPHLLDVGRDFRRGPIGVAIVCYHTTQVLESVVFVLDGCL